MTPESKFFFWGIPNEGEKTYALLDGLDNHFYLTCNNFDLLYQLVRLLRSKIILEIVELPESHTLDNTVIHKWGIANTPDWVYADVRSSKKYNDNKDKYYKFATLKNHALVETNVNIDAFKADMQEQIFLFYHCVHALQARQSDALVRRLRLVVGLSESYNDALDKLLNFNDITDKQMFSEMSVFIRTAGLFYE